MAEAFTHVMAMFNTGGAPGARSTASGHAGGVGSNVARGSSSPSSGFSTLDIISGGLTAFSGLASLRAGEANAAGLRAQAEDVGFEARQEEIRGVQSANEITEKLLDTLATQRVAMAANGIDAGDGTAFFTDTMRKGQSALSSNERNTFIRQSALKRQRRQLLLEAEGTEQMGVTNALSKLSVFAEGRANRG